MLHTVLAMAVPARTCAQTDPGQPVAGIWSRHRPRERSRRSLGLQPDRRRLQPDRRRLQGAPAPLQPAFAVLDTHLRVDAVSTLFAGIRRARPASLHEATRVPRLDRMRALLIPGAALAFVVPLTGCSVESPEAASAQQVAQEFTRTVTSSPVEACALLAPETRTEVEQTSSTCEQGMKDAGIPPGGTVLDAQVYGLDAMVELEHDTLFLARFGSGWKVTAAGCTPQGQDRPYSCQIKGA